MAVNFAVEAAVTQVLAVWVEEDPRVVGLEKMDRFAVRNAEIHVLMSKLLFVSYIEKAIHSVT